MASIILREKFPNLHSSHKISFKPMMPNIRAMLAQADAALVLESFPDEHGATQLFALDLAEEWADLTELPYVHGFWVAREEDLPTVYAERLVAAANEGVSARRTIAEAYALRKGFSVESARTKVEQFDFFLDDREQESLSEFFRQAFYHGILGDIPDLNFFDLPSSAPSKN
ncbi:MAG: hypothetical protein HY966_05335 [Ignavibacteriales bacterium]|nr:hypothetical protein [Ignavibacteriales bacterium]